MSKVIISFFLIVVVACNKVLEVNPPTERINASLVFEDDATALSAVSGMYAQMIRANLQFSSVGITLFTGLSSDEIVNSTPSSNYDEFRNNSLSSTNNMVRTNLWSPAFQIIYQANSIIEGLENSTKISSTVKSQLLGEATFVRAFCNFYLTNLFGEIPLINTTEYQLTSQAARQPIATVYDAIVKDLKTVQQLLPTTYPSAGKVRANKLVATALLARVYLFMQDWTNAEKEATDIITSGQYLLLNSLNNVFLANSSEAIWQLMPIPSSINTFEGNLFISTGAIPAYPLTSSLLNSFATNDQRKTNWTKSVIISGNTYYFPYKYKVKTATTLTEYYTVLRLAEQFLIRAEARTHQNKFSEARADINTIRTRAGLTNSNANTAAELLQVIEQERQAELFCEWGHRWFDLKRTGRANAVLSPLKTDWQSTDALYPIPFLEIQRNPFLTQNSGY